MTPTCSSCGAFQPIAQELGKVGFCRRHAPTTIAMRYIAMQLPDGRALLEAQPDSVFPAVRAELSCWEHVEKIHGTDIDAFEITTPLKKSSIIL